MQFKNPEILYFLFALIIPLLVHLFQLQKFKKVVFTNVAFLKKIEAKTRKSSRLKKWLILLLRMLLFSAVIFAFAQPYFSSEKNVQQRLHHYIYLDNSISMNAIGKRGKLLPIAAKDIIETISDESAYSLLTNSNFYPNLNVSELKTILKKVSFTVKKLSIESILLKINVENKNLNKIVLISDFQNIKKENDYRFTNITTPVSLIKLNPVLQNNISIDSIFITNKNQANFTVNVVVKNQGEAKKNIPISIFNAGELLSKKSFSIEKNSEKIIDFEIQSKPQFLGEISISYKDVFLFDNRFFFTANFNDKINVLSIGKTSAYYPNIFTWDEFFFTHVPETKMNYNLISKQQLIILNEVENIPAPLSNALTEFVEKGGSLIIVPSETSIINSYNLFFRRISLGSISKKQRDSLKITTIHYNHPVFKNVFTKKIQNFQYPSVIKSFTTTSKMIPIVSYEDATAFLATSTYKKGRLYWFSAPINNKNSNFTNSPLIVPTLYNIGQNSLRVAKPYYILQETNTIDINASIGKDDIVTIKNEHTSFIPIQQNAQNKITVITTDKPVKRGFYYLVCKDTLKTISYNNPVAESSLHYLDTNAISNKNTHIDSYETIDEYFNELKQKSKVQWLWKLFLVLAIVSLLSEILILKFFKI
ncbi:MAG: hypothetical protein GKR88_08255 [Flavobacteriaceae bacterium]|nr:MAG: hypothetical protein GKR88_08255 [Flavobacteriaceae bacterium]